MRHELAAVLGDLNGRAARSGQARLNRAILRLACCCGLRVSEIGGLQLVDVCLAGPRPHVRIRACIAKGGRSRRVPLWWDAGTLADLVAWRAERVAQGGRDGDPFICSVQAHRRGWQPVPGQVSRLLFVPVIAGGRTLAEVRERTRVPPKRNAATAAALANTSGCVGGQGTSQADVGET